MNQQPTSPVMRRRTLVKGAGWSVPAVALSAAAPAVAASSDIPPDGLNGWVTLQRQCGGWGADFIINGRGNFTGGGNNDRGIWVFIADPNATIENATIIFFFNKSDLVFSNGSETGWTNLVRSTSDDANRPANGYYAYKATYSGRWTYNATFKAWVANSDPYWSADLSPCTTVTGYARRSVVTNGKLVEFTRGPVSV